MIDWLVRWYLDRWIDDKIEPPRWIRRKLVDDPRRAEECRRMRDIDRRLEESAESADLSLAPAPLIDDWSRGNRHKSLAGASLLAAAVVLIGWICWSVASGSPTSPVTLRPVSELVDERTHQVVALIQKTRRTLVGLKVQIRDPEPKRLPPDIWRKYAQRIGKDRRRLADSLSRLVTTVSLKKAGK